MKDGRVLHFLGDLNPGGAEMVAISLAQAFKSLNWEVAICSRQGGSLAQELDGIPSIVIPKTHLLDIGYLLKLLVDITVKLTGLCIQ